MALEQSWRTVQRSGRVRLKKRGSRVRAGREDLQLLPELAVFQPLFAQPVLQDGGEGCDFRQTQTCARMGCPDPIREVRREPRTSSAAKSVRMTLAAASVNISFAAILDSSATIKSQADFGISVPCSGPAPSMATVTSLHRARYFCTSRMAEALRLLLSLVRDDILVRDSRLNAVKDMTSRCRSVCSLQRGKML